MARARLRVCTVPGCAKTQPERRCPEHQTDYDRHQRATTPTKATRTWAERQRRAGTVAAHHARHGDWCPGWQRPPHPAADLTADHRTAIAAGGDPTGPLQVLCRACNAAKGARQAH